MLSYSYANYMLSDDTLLYGERMTNKYSYSYSYNNVNQSINYRYLYVLSRLL